MGVRVYDRWVSSKSPSGARGRDGRLCDCATVRLACATVGALVCVCVCLLGCSSRVLVYAVRGRCVAIVVLEDNGWN